MRKIIFAVFFLYVNNAYCQVNVLLNWNEGQGEDFPGWQWSNDLGYGKAGWKLVETASLGLGATYQIGDGPRSMNKTDYGRSNDVSIDLLNHAPSTSTGGSLKVFSLPGGDNRSTWWVWYDGEPLSKKGITNADTNRMSMYLKLEGTPAVPENDSNFPIATAEIGTYLCWGQGNAQGEGCPYESPNQHYYHWISPNPGAWVHVLLDARPQHIRNEGVIPVREPALASYGKTYFAQMHQFYVQQSENSSTPTRFWVDEINFYSTLNTSEANQNDESVNSLWVGYWPDTDMWELGFNDSSISGDTKKTYEIRWSLSEITNSNWASASSIQPLNYGGVSTTGNANLLSRPNGWKQVAWTKFVLPNSVETVGNKVYFAVKDVSVRGGNIGTVYPYNQGDSVDAVNNLVKTIDYILGAVGNTARPNPPVIIGIQ